MVTERSADCFEGMDEMELYNGCLVITEYRMLVL